MSWGWLLIVALGLYAQKAAGPLLLAGRDVPAGARRALALLAVPLLGALVVVQTLSEGQQLQLDVRAPAVLFAALCVWRGAPFIVTVGGAAVVAAALRAVA